MGKQRNACLILIYLVVVIFAVPPAAAEAQSSQYFMDMTAREWMAWDQTTRTLWIHGYISGVTYVVRLFGADLRSTGAALFTVAEMEEMVYRELLTSPELRSGTITAITIAVVGRRMVLTDRQGVQIPLAPVQR